MDVRVVDREGKPVTDLKQEDFTVLDGGMFQPIRHFSRQELQPVDTAPGAAPAFRKPTASAIEPQPNRIFLIVFGRGRLQGPTRAVDAVARLVAEDLLPQDQVAVFAFNRASDFTNDHKKTADIIERFKRAHERIESRLLLATTGLAAIYGTKSIPAALQADIDAVFGDASAARQVPPSQDVGDASRLEQPSGRSIDVIGERLRFGRYVDVSVQSLQDLGNLYTGIDYLRYLEGQKHLIFVTEQGVSLPRQDSFTGLAARANGARVAIDVIQTGGVDVGFLPDATSRDGTPAVRTRPLDPFRVADARLLADLTGGRAFFGQSAKSAVAQIDSSTKGGYLLGYYPPAAARSGAYRPIVIRINRPGVVASYRHGYYSRDDTPPLDPKAYLIALRLSAARNYEHDITDIKLKAEASVTAQGAKKTANVRAWIDPSRLSLTSAAGQRVGSLEIVVYCVDGSDHVVGRAHQAIDLKLKPETYQRFLTDGIPYEAALPFSGEMKSAKIIVYDYDADLVGSVVVKVK